MTPDTPPSPAELAAWQALADAATPGPWQRCGCGQCGSVFTSDGMAYVHIEPAHSVDPYTNNPAADAAFIAASRSALPRLLAALAAEKARALALEALLKECSDALRWVRGTNHLMGDDWYKEMLPKLDAALAIASPKQSRESET